MSGESTELSMDMIAKVLVKRPAAPEPMDPGELFGRQWDGKAIGGIHEIHYPSLFMHAYVFNPPGILAVYFFRLKAYILLQNGELKVIKNHHGSPAVLLRELLQIVLVDNICKKLNIYYEDVCIDVNIKKIFMMLWKHMPSVNDLGEIFGVVNSVIDIYKWYLGHRELEYAPCGKVKNWEEMEKYIDQIPNELIRKYLKEYVKLLAKNGVVMICS